MKKEIEGKKEDKTRRVQKEIFYARDYLQLLFKMTSLYFAGLRPITTDKQLQMFKVDLLLDREGFTKCLNRLKRYDPETVHLLVKY